MALKTARVKIDAPGRDLGKTFVLTEMAAEPAERWAMRLVFALMNSGVELPDNIMGAGMAGIAAIGVKALGKLPFEAAEPLLLDMFDCVTIAPDPKNPNLTRSLVTGDIEEVITRLMLRKELFKLHIDFFTTAEPSTPE
jgi:hypothetical protein